MDILLTDPSLNSFATQGLGAVTCGKAKRSNKSSFFGGKYIQQIQFNLLSPGIVCKVNRWGWELYVG